MKKGSVVLWVVAMMLIATGVSLSATSSQASDLDGHLKARCGFGQRSGDQVIGLRLSNIWGNVMSFGVQLSVDAAHYYGSDGISRPHRLQGVRVTVLPFDKNGKRLWSSFEPGNAGLAGSSEASVSITLASGHSLGQLVDLLVVVEEEGHKGGFKFCKVWKYANVYTGAATSQRPRTQAVFLEPPAPPGQPPRVVGIAMSKKRPRRIYTYFDNGTFSVLEADLHFIRNIQQKIIIKSKGYYLPSGKKPHHIVGMAMSPSDRVYVWFKDQTFSSGTYKKLDYYSTPKHYDLPKGKTPFDIVGMAIDRDPKGRVGEKHNDNDNLVHVWFKDGSACLGRPDGLGVYIPNVRYRPKLRNPIDVHGMAIGWDGEVYTWYKRRLLIGKSPELNRFGEVNSNVLKAGPMNHYPVRIVGKAIAKSNNHVYTWFDNGTVCSGTYGHVDKYRKPYKSELPLHKSPYDIVGIAIASDDHVYVWFKDYKFISGTSKKLYQYRTPSPYSLPPGKTPDDIVGMAIGAIGLYAKTGRFGEEYNLVYTWFKDGSFCVGTADDLDKYKQLHKPHNYKPKLKNPILGMAMDHVDRVITWYSDRIYIGTVHKLNKYKDINLRVLYGGW